MNVGNRKSEKLVFLLFFMLCFFWNFFEFNSISLLQTLHTVCWFLTSKIASQEASSRSPANWTDCTRSVWRINWSQTIWVVVLSVYLTSELSVVSTNKSLTIQIQHLYILKHFRAFVKFSWCMIYFKLWSSVNPMSFATRKLMIIRWINFWAHNF